jgi:hypothetical protein
MQQENEYLSLIRILEKEKDSYVVLQGLLLEKQRAVISGEVDALRDIIIKEKSAAKNCAALAKERILFLNNFCEDHGINGTDIPLRDFIGFSTEPEKKKLENIRYDMKNILTDIKRINRQNETLLHFSINHVREMTHIFLHSAPEENNMYTFKGQKYIKEINQKFVNQQI